MAVKIRLARRGRKKAPFYHVVVADSRAPRDGKFIEKIGSYNPMTKPATIELDREKALDWLMKGAQPTDTARALLRFKGVLYRKHLLRGVSKGAMNQEQADKLYQDYINEKEQKVASRIEQTRKEKLEFLKMVSGKPGGQVSEVKAASEELAAFNETNVQESAQEVVVAETETSATTNTVEETIESPVVESVVEEVAPEEIKEEKVEVAEEPKVEIKKETIVTSVTEKVVSTTEKIISGTSTPDDLTKIEGIGPAIAKLLNSKGVTRFASIAALEPSTLKNMLTSAGGNLAMHDPTSWPQQAGLAAKGEWDALNKLQDELDGGKIVNESKEEE